MIIRVCEAGGVLVWDELHAVVTHRHNKRYKEGGGLNKANPAESSMATSYRQTVASYHSSASP